MLWTQSILHSLSLLDEPTTSETKWFKPDCETPDQNASISSPPDVPYSEHARNLTLSEDLRSSLIQDSSDETQPSFFNISSSEVFLASSMTSTTSQPISGAVPFPRKLPEIANQTDGVADHRSVAIHRLKNVLEGIQYFDRYGVLKPQSRVSSQIRVSWVDHRVDQTTEDIRVDHRVGYHGSLILVGTSATEYEIEGSLEAEPFEV